MGYGRLNETDPGGTSGPGPAHDHLPTPNNPRKRRFLLLSLLSILLIVAAAVSATFLVGIRTASHGRSDPNLPLKPTQAISKACSRTRYPTLCVNSLLDFPDSLDADEHDLVHISFNITLQRLNKALYSSSEISPLQMDLRVRSAYDACLELLDDSVDALSRSLQSIAPSSSSSDGRPQRIGSSQDVITWLSAALTNQDTCTDGFAELTGAVKDQMTDKLHNLSELVSNCLALFSGSETSDFDGVPIQNKRRLMEAADEESGNFPRWMSRRERRLLTMPVSALQADIVVSQNGSGTVKTIAEAIKKAPQYSSRRTIIYVMAGR